MRAVSAINVQTNEKYEDAEEGSEEDEEVGVEEEDAVEEKRKK